MRQYPTTEQRQSSKILSIIYPANKVLTLSYSPTSYFFISNDRDSGSRYILDLGAWLNQILVLLQDLFGYRQLLLEVTFLFCFDGMLCQV